MNEHEQDELVRQIEAGGGISAPGHLRDRVIADARRELAAGRWDRRLARVAAVLLLFGIGLNATLSVRVGENRSDDSLAARRTESLAQVAGTVAEITDKVTARRVAQQMAAQAGWRLSAEQTGAIESALLRHEAPPSNTGKDG